MVATTRTTQSEQLKSAQSEVAEAAQNQFLASVKAQQKIALDAATLWAEQVVKLHPAVPAGFATLVREQAKKSSAAYDELVAAHREFSERLLRGLGAVDAGC